MEKSRPRRYPTVKSNLNMIRETFIAFCSLLLWGYCAVVLYTFFSIFISQYTFVTQLVLTIIKLEANEIKTFFLYLVAGMCVIAVYLLINYKFNKFEVKEHEAG